MSCNLATYGACGLVSKRRTKDGGCKSYFVHGSFRSVFWKIPGYTVFEMRALPVLVPFIRIFILGALRDARQRTEGNLHARLRQDHIDKPCYPLLLGQILCFRIVSVRCVEQTGSLNYSVTGRIQSPLERFIVPI